MEDYLNIFKSTLDTEFEVRFGTQQHNITKIDFNRVIQKLKSLGFYSYNSQYLLKIQNQFIILWDSSIHSVSLIYLKAYSMPVIIYIIRL